MYGDKLEEDCLLVAQPAQKLAFIHAVLEGFAAVDKDDWNFVGELPPQLFVAVDIHFVPGKPTAALQLTERFLHDLAQVAALCANTQRPAEAGPLGGFYPGRPPNASLTNARTRREILPSLRMEICSASVPPIRARLSF